MKPHNLVSLSRVYCAIVDVFGPQVGLKLSNVIIFGTKLALELRDLNAGKVKVFLP
jgi:hypothetical protein